MSGNKMSSLPEEKKTDEVTVKSDATNALTEKKLATDAEENKIEKSEENKSVDKAMITQTKESKTPASDEEKMEESVISETGNVGDNEEDDSEEDEEELPPGLLEIPVKVEGKRERKKTTRFNPDNAESDNTPKKELKVPDGRGVELSKHPRVVTQLAKNQITDLKLIHKLFFGTLGDKKTIKLNIQKFKGFAFEKDTPEFEKKEEEVGRFTVSNLKWVMGVCDACESFSALKSKDDLVDAFMDWTLNPQPQSKKKPAKRKMKAVTTGEAGDTTTDSGTPVKIARKKSTKDKKPKTKEKNDDASEEAKSEEDSAQPPTNAQIKKFITKVLKGADLEELTMKSVFVQVYAKYPLHDLSDRKPFIKDTVKKLIS